MLRVAANHCDEGEEEQGEDQDDLAAGQPEFGLAVGSDGQDINSARRGKKKKLVFILKVLWTRDNFRCSGTNAVGKAGYSLSRHFDRCQWESHA